MAEASSDRVPLAPETPMFFCHKCKTEIRPVIPEYKCPRCDGGFIEELSDDNTDHSDHSDLSNQSGSDRRHSLERDEDPSRAILFRELLSQVLNDPAGPPPHNPFLRSASNNTASLSSSSSSASPSTDVGSSSTSGSSTGNPGAADVNRDSNRDRNRDINRESNQTAFIQRGPGRTITFTSRGGPIGGGIRGNPPPPEMITLLQHLMGGIGGFGNTPPSPFGPGGIGFPVQMFNIHGSPRDYAWGEGGLDAIITQLLNNAEGHGAPPANRDDISRLESVVIDNVHIEQSSECPVCKEDFEVGESAKKLPCAHFFHPPCVDTWLEMHNTCPVCRKSIGPGDGGRTNTSSS